jgi:integrase
MYRHGLRVSEAIALRWEQADLKAGLLHVNRLKNGFPSTHPLRGPELRALRQLRRDWPDSPYLFASERGGPMTASNVRKLVTRAGQTAALPFPAHPHMLRHACGFKLANDGHDTRSLQHYLGQQFARQLGEERERAYLRRIGYGNEDPQRPVSHSLFSRFAPSMVGCQPETSEIMNTSICRSSGAVSLAVDL